MDGGTDATCPGIYHGPAFSRADRLELLIDQIWAVEVERDAVLAQDMAAMSAPATMLLDIKGISPEFATIISTECLSRHIDKSKTGRVKCGLAASPWRNDIDQS